MLARQRGGALVQRPRRDGGGRVVRVVQPQQRDAAPRVGVDRVEVGEEPGVLAQRQLQHLLAGEHGAALVDGVGRRRDRDEVAAEHLGHVEDGLLGAERRQHLRIRVERDAEAPRGPFRDRGAQVGQPVRRRVGGERLERRDERLADERGRLLARLADAEVDEVDAVRPQPLAWPRRGARTGRSACR